MNISNGLEMSHDTSAVWNKTRCADGHWVTCSASQHWWEKYYPDQSRLYRCWHSLTHPHTPHEWWLWDFWDFEAVFEQLFSICVCGRRLEVAENRRCSGVERLLLSEMRNVLVHPNWLLSPDKLRMSLTLKKRHGPITFYETSVSSL